MRSLGLFFASLFSMLAFTVPAQAAPVCGNSVVESGEDCDDGNTEPGDCCSPSCQYESPATVCRAPAGVCDAPDHCDGVGSCTADAKLFAECRASAGDCDVADSCDGVSDDCPSDVLLPAGTECRAGSGVCDPAWFCDGVSPECVPLIPYWEIVCRASTGACDPEEICDGDPDCPPDVIFPDGIVCRPVGGLCDIEEVCDGANPHCPVDAVEPSATECRPAVQICDAVEYCDGVSKKCPITMPASGLPCPDGDLCNGDEFCVGWVCMPGEPLICDDDWACTADSCDPELGCVYEQIHGPGCIDTWLPSASPTGRLLLSLLLVAAGLTFLARRGRRGA